jgi:hypothetical protein
VEYTLANLGNRAESVVIAAVAPAGWRVLGGDRVTANLEVNQIRESAFVLDVPSGAATGSAAVRLIASLGGRPVASAEAGVFVMAEGKATGTGPLLTTSLAVGDGYAGRAYGVAASLDGQLTRDVRITGRISGPQRGAGGGSLALYRLGHFAWPSSLELNARSWRLAMGYTGIQFGDLTGYNVSGTGAGATIRGRRWNLSTLAVKPGSGYAGDTRDGLVAGGRVEFNTGRATVAATGTHLDERGFENRALDALALGAVLPRVWHGEFSSEVAYRRFATGSGIGYSVGFDRRTPKDVLSLRVAHAPGGRAAFAPAVDRVNLSASRTLTRFVGLHGGVWSSRDGATVSFSRLATAGWAGGVNLNVTDGLSLGLGGRGSRFQAAGIAGDLATSEQALDVRLNLNAGRLFAHGQSSIGFTRRETASLLDSLRIVDEGRRMTVDGTIGVRSDAGVFTLSGRMDRSGLMSGVIPVNAEIAARAERVPMLRLRGVRVVATAEVRRASWQGLGTSQTTIIGGLAALLPQGFSVELAAERNPYFVQHTGGAGWVYGIRIERAMRLPGFGREESRGVVYQDLNRNGERDEGEPGLAGAVIRRGAESRVTGEDGTYRLAGASGGLGSLDPLSLNRGWITGTAREVNGRQEIAVMQVTPVAMVLRLIDSAGLGIAPALLADAVVLARDESGRVWVARRAGHQEAFFDALPSGRYTVELDLGDVKEPLVVVGTLPAFAIRPGAPVPSLEVRVQPRPVRVRELGPAPSSARTGATP